MSPTRRNLLDKVWDGRNLLDKVWDAHTVRELPGGQTQLFIGLHLIHEVTSPQAFAMLREMGLRVRIPSRTFATVDHIIPTTSQRRPLADPLAEEMLVALEHNCAESGISLFDPASGRQGIVHVIGPELGLTQPGMTIACGDSHTATHGAFGAVAFGIGTSQLRDVLATQCLTLARPKVRRIDVSGKLAPGVYAKDVILAIIRKLGVKGGVGFAYEYAGAVIDSMSIEERLTVCNMSIEGGARCGYVNPDDATFDYLRGREFAPEGEAFERALAWWRGIASGPDATYDDEVEIDGSSLAPSVTWGIHPGQSVAVDERRSTRPSPSWGSSPASPSRASPSTWRSSARAPTAASRTCAKRPAWRRRARWPRRCGRSWCRAPRPSPARRTPRGSTRCSAPPGSSGARRAARCAWP
jgi:3-isopropylmalate/(R)-2-methylmalate dehydratase large subunit